MIIILFSLVICHSCGCFQTSIYIYIYIYIFPTNLNISLMLPMLRLLQNFKHYYHGDCRLLADGMRVFYLECCYCFITVLDRRSRSSYPWYSHQNAFTLPFSGHPPVTHYTNNLKKSYLDVLL